MLKSGEFFSCKNTPEDWTDTHKGFPYKQVSERNGDHKLLRMTNASYYVIYYEKLRNVMQQIEKV